MQKISFPQTKTTSAIIDALKKIIRRIIPYQDIIRAGRATWVPQSVIRNSFSHMLNVYNGGYRPKFKSLPIPH